MLSGQVPLCGAVLANEAGRLDDIMVAAGQVVVTSQITTLGFQRVIVAGHSSPRTAGRARSRLPDPGSGRLVRGR